MKNRKFKERQKYGFEVIALVSFFAIVTIYRFVEQAILQAPASDTLTLSYLAFIAILGMGIYYLVNTQMITNINTERIKYRLTSWSGRSQKIKWEEVSSFSVIHMSTSAELCGWGVNFSGIDNTVRLYGGSGLLLELKNGEQLFIGSRNTKELESFLTSLPGKAFAKNVRQTAASKESGEEGRVRSS